MAVNLEKLWNRRASIFIMTSKKEITYPRKSFLSRNFKLYKKDFTEKGL